MQPFYETKSGVIYHADNLAAMQEIESASVDSCISDFPYAIEFMNKQWDSSKSWHDGDGKHSEFKGTGYTGKRRPNFYLNSSEDLLAFYDWCFARAVELIRIMKPGGYVAIFGHPKTNHRMKCAFEDAGFQIVEEIDWMYMCLSEDTKILTKSGWKSYNQVTTDDYVMTLNTESNTSEWQKVNFVHIYDYSGKMCHIKTYHTDQLVTPNHRLLYKHRLCHMVKSEHIYYYGDYEYQEATQLKPKYGVLFPLAAPYKGSLNIGEKLSYLLGFILGDGMYHKDCDAISIYQTSAKPELVDKIRDTLVDLGIKFSEYQRDYAYKDKVNGLSLCMSESYVENYVRKHKNDVYTQYQFYIGVKESRKIREIIPKIELSVEMIEWSYEDRLQLFYGLIDSDGSTTVSKNGSISYALWQKDEKFREIFQILCFSLGFRTSWDDRKMCVGVSKNQFTSIQSKYFETVNGVKKLPTEDYNGVVWCVSTDNTNFVARRNGKIFITGNSGMPKCQDIGKMYERAGNKEQAGLWSDWKTAGLKPAHEPITIFQKPMIGTYLQNIEQYGCGAMNIGACRVPISKEDIEMLDAKASKNPTTNYSDRENKIYSAYAQDMAMPANPDGRFPPNIVIDDEIAKDLDLQTGESTSTGGSGIASRVNRCKHTYGAFNEDTQAEFVNESLGGYGDSGGRSRLFPIFKYCPKVSPKERMMPDGSRNPHVTLKPLDLIKWLIKLLTPKDGLTIDITAGSCTHAVACEQLNFDLKYKLRYIDIELMNDEENPYCDVGAERIKHANSGKPKRLF